MEDGSRGSISISVHVNDADFAEEFAPDLVISSDDFRFQDGGRGGCCGDHGARRRRSRGRRGGEVGGRSKTRPRGALKRWRKGI